MNKKEHIERYGEESYKQKLKRNRAWYKANREKETKRKKRYLKEHPEKAKAMRMITNREQDRKGGKRYNKKLKYNRTGLRGKRNRIRWNQVKQYKQYKDIIAPESQIHHEWIPKTAKYRGVALVEANPPQYGIIDVIQILDGEITLLTEEDVKNGNKIKEES